jgi:hypothetical protein
MDVLSQLGPGAWLEVQSGFAKRLGVWLVSIAIVREKILPLDDGYSFGAGVSNFDCEVGITVLVRAERRCSIDEYVRCVSRCQLFVGVVLGALCDCDNGKQNDER